PPSRGLLMLVIVVIVGGVFVGPTAGPGVRLQPPTVFALTVVKRVGQGGGRDGTHVDAQRIGLASGTKVARGT
ncbi:MAG: hypothetical protein ACUVQH_15145, partial [Thermogutta sp.]